MKLTSSMLRRIIAEEAAKFGQMRSTEDAAGDVEEVDADEYADALEKKIDYCKALKIEEGRLRKRLNRIAETRGRVLRSIAKSTL